MSNHQMGYYRWLSETLLIQKIHYSNMYTFADTDKIVGFLSKQAKVWIHYSSWMDLLFLKKRKSWIVNLINSEQLTKVSEEVNFSLETGGGWNVWQFKNKLEKKKKKKNSLFW